MPTIFAMQEWTDILDESALTRLAQLDPGHRAGLVLKLLRVFASSLDTYTVQMAAARAGHDKVTAKRVAHTVRTSASNMGAVELTRLAGTCESVCGTDPDWAESTLIDQFIAACSSMRKIVEDRLA